MLKIPLLIIAICLTGIINWMVENCVDVAKPAKKENCTIVFPIGNSKDFRCCFVSFKRKKDDKDPIKQCKVFPYDGKKLETIKSITYKNVKELDIQCSSHFLFMGLLILIMLLF